MIKKFKLYKEESGAGLVWFAITFVIIIFMTGLAIDGGRLFLSKIDLRKTANAAALSGAQELTESASRITNVVNEILTENKEESSLKQLLIKPNNENKITVTLEKNVPMYFMKIFGIKYTPVQVASSAAIFPMAETKGAVPFGISKDTQFEFMKEYTLKVDAGDSSTGNFGIMALAGTGGRLYEDALKYGYNDSLKAGDIIDTQTGNVEQKTIKGVNYRIDNSPYTEYAEDHRDDPRIVAILVYEPYQVSTNQLKSIKIDGFAFFYLTQPMSSSDSTVKGYFIRKTGTGYGNSNVLDKGAYAIKLVE
ncbi:TadE/TadG family type IV pilus assembly protein [Clostridium omnivorum]|uniref:Putative Flp pilus-assembly TadG-like N-terminal domain-containing protein n=1 Tax=Clostridium omnivorum TaxID=1604902 RepID=A0ABQ5N1A3_9CLOT|nr:TadE/TadG family type IV pilus assembly protein [Clostridium sp. E14]GLC28993.1 hypothetical protein bsdE14_04030 [Clostridium sp. E14]